MLQSIGTVISVIEVIVFLLGYLQRKRIAILVFNITSRVLYILSYVFLGALSGALLDVMGTAIAALAGKKNSGFHDEQTFRFSLQNRFQHPCDIYRSSAGDLWPSHRVFLGN